MAFDMVKVGTDVIVGGAAGAVDRLIESEDEKREDAEHKAGKLATDKKLPVMSRYGTYYNFVPLAISVVGVGAGLLSDDWATRTVAVSSALAGRKIAYNATTKARPIPASTWTVWEREKAGAGTGSRSAAPTGGSHVEF